MKKALALVLSLLTVASLTPSQSTAPAPLGPPPAIDLSTILSAVTYTTNGIASHDATIQAMWSKQVADEASIATLQAQAPIPGPQGPQGVPGNPSSTIGILVYPSTLVYNPQTIGTTSPPQFVMVSNQTNTALPLTAPALVGPFQLGGGGNCGGLVSLPAGQNCVYGIQFKTGSIGAKVGTLTVNVGGLQLPVSLEGMGQ